MTISGGSVGAGSQLPESLLPENGAYGGFTFRGDVTENRVFISGGNVVGGVFGGRGSNGTVAGNSVSISGGSVVGSVYGGHSTDGTATNNSVTISGNPDLTAASLFGGNTPASAATDGNTLNIHGFQGSVQGIADFQYYKLFLPASMHSGDTLLTLQTGPDLTGTTVRIGIEGGGTPLAVGMQ